MNIKKALGILALGLMAITIRAQSVNTVIGPDANVFSLPGGVAVDAGESIYVTDAELHRIIQFTTTNGILRQLAGVTGQFGSANGSVSSATFFAPRGIAYLRGGLYVADSGNHTIRFIDLATRTVSTVAGRARTQGAQDGAGLEARFSSPYGLVADAAGNLYVADSRNGAIRVMDAAHNVRTLATGFVEPTGISLGDAGRLVVADRSAHLIYVVNPDGSKSVLAGSGESGFEDGLALSARFSAPESVIHLSSGFGTVVTDAGNHVLRRIHTNDVGQMIVQLYAGSPGETNLTDGILGNARFNVPTVMSRFQSGFLALEEGNRSVRQLLPQPQLPRISTPKIGYVVIIIDRDTGRQQLALIPVTDETFDNDLVIAVLGEQNVVNYFTYGQAKLDISDPDTIPDPRNSQATAQPYRNGAPPEDMPPSIIPRTFPETTIKAQSRATGRSGSEVVQATFRFKVAAPRIDAANPNAISLRTLTTNAVMYYTLDGSDPTEGYVEGHPTKTNRNTLGPKNSGETISIPLTGATITLKVRGYRDGYRQSDIATMELSQETITPNRISLGFNGGEGSSEFIAAPGQRFYIPITMTVLPNQAMHGLQFAVKLQNGTGPAPAALGDYAFRFQSMLMERQIDDTYTAIPPASIARIEQVINAFTNIAGGVTNVVTLTNTVAYRSNLVSTNVEAGLLSVGWLERLGSDFFASQLFDPDAQHLVQYSSAHDTIFESKNGKVVVGAYSFVVPATASPGQTYSVRLIRPSATFNLSDDVYIEAPYADNPFTTLRAEQSVVVGQAANRSYIVGDVAPFRWLNAGDFGDTNILNNDVLQIFQSAVYLMNTPEAGSDFYDAMDTCCNGADGLPVTTGSIFDGNDTNTINSVIFGDGVLDFRDVFVAFRRGLDPGLKWYARFWRPDGTLGFTEAPNQFRGSTNLFSKGAIQAFAAPAPGVPTLRLHAESSRANAGDKVTLPVRAAIRGAGIRGLMFKARVEALHQAPGVRGIGFQGSAIGAPLLADGSSSSYAGAWTYLPSLQGELELGMLSVQLPTNAPAGSQYIVHLEHVSATGDGLIAHETTTLPAIIDVGQGAIIAWNDSIPDEWRKLYFGHLANPFAGAGMDPDGDGVSNADEYLAGTNPAETLSRLAVSVSRNGFGQLSLRWQTVAGKKYRVESATRLLPGDWAALGDADGTGAESSQIIPEDSRARFFRVRALP